MKEGLNSISNLDEYDFSSITSLFPPELSDDIKHQLEFFLRQYRNTVFPVPVDYALSLQKLIAIADFSRVNENVNGVNFPEGAKGSPDVRIKTTPIHIVRAPESGTRWLVEKGLRHASLRELVSLHRKCPDTFLEERIEAHGSLWQKSRCVAWYAYIQYGNLETTYEVKDDPKGSLCATVPLWFDK